EPAASTSQTSRATNCATPRCPFVLLIIADFLPAVKGRVEKIPRVHGKSFSRGGGCSWRGRVEKIPLRVWEIRFSRRGAVLGVGKGGKIPCVHGKSFSRGGELFLAGQGGKNPLRAWEILFSWRGLLLVGRVEKIPRVHGKSFSVAGSCSWWGRVEKIPLGLGNSFSREGRSLVKGVAFMRLPVFS
ncbi:MAG: hypothetical protein IKD02_02885, partial [Clostridia bacterium]|nr:hypothetical protein [Clostridia bacterium]